MFLPKLRASVHIQREDSLIYMVDEERGEMFQMNETAARIFGYCKAQLSVEEAVADILSELTSAEQHLEVHADVCAVAKELEDLGLCVPDSRCEAQ